MEAAAPLIASTLAIALTAGILAQAVGERLSIPSIVPLLVFGTALGPQGLGWLHPEALGTGLEVIVAFSVAIILFEGSLALEWESLRTRGAEISRLISVGALVTFVGAGLAAWLLLPVEPSVAWLLGSLVIVTGPTVIRPLLKRVRIQRRIGLILESEGVLIDPIGAIVAVVVLEAVLAGEFSLAFGPGSFLARIGIGAIVGALSGWLLGFLLRFRWAHEPEIANLAVLTGAIVTFVGSNALQSESGLMAVVASGLVLNRMPIVGRREILQFKGVLTTIVISLLFVLLSADIDWSVLGALGWRGPAWVAVLMFVVRPLNVFVSTWGRLSLRDKLLLSWISPRGIVAASVASLFAIYLEREHVPGAELLQPLVFLTIAITILFQGLTARSWARLLHVSAESYGVVIVGASALGRLLGVLLQQEGREVALIDSNPRHCERAKRRGLAAYTGNCLDAENLERIGLRVSDQIVAVTPNSDVNYLVCRLGREDFGVPRALALEHEDDKPVSPKTRESHGVERAFAKAVREDLHPFLRGQPVVRRFRVADGVSDRLDALALDEVLPLVRIRDGRAEVCGDATKVTEEDHVILLGEAGAEWLGGPVEESDDQNSRTERRG